MDLPTPSLDGDGRDDDGRAARRPRASGPPSWPAGRSLHGGVDEVPLPSSRGRLWLCGKRYVGPDPDAALAEVAATTVVCLCEEAELADRFPRYVAWLRDNEPARALWHPIPDLSAPPLVSALELWRDLCTRLSSGEGVVVHCGAGIGRAGTVAAGLLMTLGLSKEEAVARVGWHRPMGGPEVGAQSELLDALEAFLATSDGLTASDGLATSDGLRSGGTSRPGRP